MNSFTRLDAPAARPNRSPEPLAQLPQALRNISEEVIDFLAAGRSPSEIIEFRPSDEAWARVHDLAAREKSDGLSAEETTELDDYMRLKHQIRLTKARARAMKQSAP